jgi:choline dehydrogenase-like flavoprotein
MGLSRYRRHRRDCKTGHPEESRSGEFEERKKGWKRCDWRSSTVVSSAGFRVVALEAAPFWDIEKDSVSDEKGAHELHWNDLLITGGKDPLPLGANNSGKNVSGGSVHWAAFTPRFHPSDFRVFSEDGVGADRPMSYWDLKPYYELLEQATGNHASSPGTKVFGSNFRLQLRADNR